LARERPGKAGHHQLLPTSQAILDRHSLNEQECLGPRIWIGHPVQFEIPVASDGYQIPGPHEPLHLSRAFEISEIMGLGRSSLPVQRGDRASQALAQYGIRKEKEKGKAYRGKEPE
jgi:hypothetical protein